MPDGRRNTFSAKLSDAEASDVKAAIEAAGLKPAVWVREQLVAAARRAARKAVAPATLPAAPDSTSRVKAPPDPKPKNCRHPNLRMAKGVCPDCTTYVAKK